MEYIQAFTKAIQETNLKYKKKILTNMFDKLGIDVRGHFTDFFYTQKSVSEKIKRL